MKLGQEAPQAPAFSDAVLLHHHPEKGRHGVRKSSFENLFSKGLKIQIFENPGGDPLYPDWQSPLGGKSCGGAFETTVLYDTL